MDSQNIATYIPVYDYIPEEWEASRTAIIEYLRAITEGVNIRTVGSYETIEQLTGQDFIPTDKESKQRSVFRKVIDMEGLETLPKSIPHGISISANTHFIKIYGTATNPSTSFIPLPYVDITTPEEGIQVDVDMTNVNLNSSKSYSGYTTAYVILEYIQES